MAATREAIGSFGALADDRARLLEYLLRPAWAPPAGREDVLARASQHVLSAPGKLLRPRLVVDACRAVGGDPELVLPAAAGTEFGHIASLVHDDIIDGDTERRGQVALHVKHGVPAAVLTGDLLIFRAFLSYTECRERGVSAERTLEAIRLLSATCVDLCRGQALEAEIAGDLGTTERVYLEMIGLKTAGVYRAAAQIGACLGGGSEASIAALGSYGEQLGIAFQIVDDVLAFEEPRPLLGKPRDSDTRNRRVTLPMIYAIQSGGPRLREQIAHLLVSRDGHARLAALLRSARALDQARARAYRATAQAKHQLDRLPSSGARERLRRLADALLTRDR